MNKATYPGALGLEASRKRCDELLAEGLQYLDVLDSTESLAWLARFIVDRGK